MDNTSIHGGGNMGTWAESAREAEPKSYPAATSEQLVKDGLTMSRNGKRYQYVKGFFGIGYRWKRIKRDA